MSLADDLDAELKRRDVWLGVMLGFFGSVILLGLLAIAFKAGIEAERRAIQKAHPELKLEQS